MERYYSEKEAAEILNCSVPTMYRKRIAGEIKFHRKAGIKYLREDIEEYMGKKETGRSREELEAENKALKEKLKKYRKAFLEMQMAVQGEMEE